jgi:hypothetical protein
MAYILVPNTKPKAMIVERKVDQDTRECPRFGRQALLRRAGWCLGEGL